MGNKESMYFAWPYRTTYGYKVGEASFVLSLSQYSASHSTASSSVMESSFLAKLVYSVNIIVIGHSIQKIEVFQEIEIKAFLIFYCMNALDRLVHQLCTCTILISSDCLVFMHMD